MKIRTKETLIDALARGNTMNTGNQVLVEASPVDTIWGIGLAQDNPAAEDPDTWKGLNLLGFALMEVREQLNKQQGV